VKRNCKAEQPEGGARNLNAREISLVFSHELSDHSCAAPLNEAQGRAFAQDTDCEHPGGALRGLIVAIALTAPFWILFYLLMR